MPGAAEDLRRQHARQDDGHCGVCRGGNFQTGRVVHPCSLYNIASAALVERVKVARVRRRDRDSGHDPRRSATRV